MAAIGNSTYGAHIAQGEGAEVFRTISRQFTSQSRYTNNEDEKDSPISKADDWKLMPTVKQFAQDDPAAGRRLGVSWKDLTVKGISADAAVKENALSQFNILQQIKGARAPAPLKTIIDSSSGCVKPGEMLLVLGRPGSGCTTLLKMLANRRQGYVAVSGCPLTNTDTCISVTPRSLETYDLVIWITNKLNNTVAR